MTSFDEAGRAILTIDELVEAATLINRYNAWSGRSHSAWIVALERYTVDAADRERLIERGHAVDRRRPEEVARQVRSDRTAGKDPDRILVLLGLADWPRVRARA